MTTFKEFTFEVTEETANVRLDRALATHPEIESRSQATSLIDRGLVTFSESPVKPARKTAVGERYHVRVPIINPIDLVPYDFPLDIVYEDKDLMVINKPSGLVVHPAYGHYQDTLVNALLFHAKSLAKADAPTRPGIVHRLDKETSGLIVVAKHDSALRALARQFKRKTVHRVYWAVVYGNFRGTKGTITSYLRRHPTDRKRFASEKLTSLEEPQGKLAITHYSVKAAHDSGLTLIHLQLETGRTHQIRVHLSEQGHPIVADPFYCNSGRSKSIASTKLRKAIDEVPHLMLHAAELGFAHPRTDKMMYFRVSWPTETRPILETLGFAEDRFTTLSGPSLNDSSIDSHTEKHEDE